MERGHVRAVLGRHALPGPGHAWSDADPTRLLDAWVLDDPLQELQRASGESRLRELGHDYAVLWARTFRTLVRHLRGRPERALSLFVAEVYPFLRGDRLAARLEEARPGAARVSLAGGLPPAYLAGLVEGFVNLSGAEAQATALPAPLDAPATLVQVAWRLRPAERLSRFVQQAALLRLPLLSCALLGALLGVALAFHLAGPLEPWRVAAVLAGAVAVQVGSNAWHDLHARHPAGILGAPRLGRPALWRLVWAGYLPAAILGVALAWNNVVVLLFAFAGVAVSVLFARFRGAGWGPVLAGLTYGPLLAEGALHAVLPGALDHVGHLAAVLWTLPVGALAAAILYLDDLADRPLDQAGGHRTLLVRLPQAGHWLGLASLLLPATGLLAALVALAAPGPLALLVASLVLVLAAVAILLRVRGHLDDPHALSPDRVAAVALHLAASAVTILALVHP